MPGASVRDVGGKHASFCARSQIARPRTRAHECIGDGALVPHRERSRVLRPARWLVRWRADGSHELGVFAGTPASVRSTELSFVAWQAGELALSGGHRRWAFVDGVDDLGVVDAAEIHRGNGKVCVLDMRVIWQLGQGSRHRLSSVADWRPWLDTRWARSGGRPEGGRSGAPTACAPSGWGTMVPLRPVS